MSDRLLRQPLLDDDPEIESLGPAGLCSLVTRIERQAEARYAHLAARMARRGETATAAALRQLLAQQRERVQAVEHWAARLGGAADGNAEAVLPLPPSLHRHWDEASRSALLTPYRVFALAVESARRAFTFYSYLSARTQDSGLRTEIEALAADELRHAAALRRLRRRAWHAERRPMRLPDLTVRSSQALDAVLAQHEAVIAMRLGAIARQLRHLGDADNAALLEQVLQPARTLPEAAAGATGQDPVVRGHDTLADGGEDARALLATWADDPADGAGSADATTPLRLLVLAQKPLEALSETLEAILRTSEGPLFEQAAAAAADVTARMARITREVERQLQGEPAPPLEPAGR